MFIELLFIHLTLKRKSLIIFTLYSASNYFRISYSLSIFHSCSCVYRLNPVWLANQGTPQKTGSSSHKIQNLFSSFPFCHWNGRLFFWTEHSFSGKPLLANIKERKKYINNINGRFLKKEGLSSYLPPFCSRSHLNMDSQWITGHAPFFDVTHSTISVLFSFFFTALTEEVSGVTMYVL